MKLKYFGGILISQLLLSCVAWYLKERYLVPVLILMFLLLLIQSLWMMSRIQRVFEGLSFSLDTLRTENPEKAFSLYEESLVSKIQNQILSLFEDIRHRERKVRESREKLSSLLTDLSHQLKTPLTRVNLYTDLIKEEPGEERLHLELEDSVKQLTWLTESLIKLSSVETGLIQLFPVNAVLRETLFTALTRINACAVEKRINILLKEFEECEVYHDPKWSAEVFINLLENSIKYSPSGTAVTITGVKRELSFVVTVSDQGPGIPYKEQNKIFERFYRGKNVRHLPGGGIGLSLSRKIMENQRGSVCCQRECSGGAVFSLIFPLEV